MNVDELIIENEGEDIYVVADGVRIAKRGPPGTLQAETWISLKPGWTVLDCRDDEGEAAIEVSYKYERVH